MLGEAGVLNVSSILADAPESLEWSTEERC